jgi:hypothetical protein
MACDSKVRCVEIVQEGFKVPDPLDLNRPMVINIVPIKHSWGTWQPGVRHWRCRDCGSKKPDDPAPRAAQKSVPTVSELRAQEARIRQKIGGIY